MVRIGSVVTFSGADTVTVRSWGNVAVAATRYGPSSFQRCLTVGPSPVCPSPNAHRTLSICSRPVPSAVSVTSSFVWASGGTVICRPPSPVPPGSGCPEGLGAGRPGGSGGPGGGTGGPPGGCGFVCGAPGAEGPGFVVGPPAPPRPFSGSPGSYLATRVTPPLSRMTP